MSDDQDRQRSHYPPLDEPSRGGYYAQPVSRDGPPREEKSSYPPPPEDTGRGGYYQQGSPANGPPRDDRSGYPMPDQARQHPYPYDPRTGQYQPPPPQWNGQYPPPSQYPDPSHAGYQYSPGVRGDPGQHHPPADGYRLPPPFPGPGYPYGPPPHHYAAPPAPAPRQRTAIACKYCRKRKIRCSGYEGSPEGRCQNCVRFNQQCLFHPVSSQGAFVPASAVYGPGARGPAANDSQGDYRAPPRGQMYPRDGEPPMLYGAHGQPLGPVNPRDGPPASYPPPANYPPAAYQNGSGPGPQHGSVPAYDYRGQVPHAEQIVSRKRSPPDDDPHNENAHSSQSPHPNARPRTHDSRTNSNGNGYDYPDPTNIAPTSPTTSTTSYQSHPPAGYYNTGGQPQARNASPQSAHSYDSPRPLPIRTDGRSPPPAQPSSAGSGSASGRSGMSVRDMLGQPNSKGPGSELRDRNDNEMLSKLDGKKK